MSSKRKSRQQTRDKRKKLKKNRAKKLAFQKQLLLRPVESEKIIRVAPVESPDFGVDNYEDILAEERFWKSVDRAILFRQFR